MESCKFCNRAVTTVRRPYVCQCGAYLGRHGWKRTVTVDVSKKRANRLPREDSDTAYRALWAKIHSCVYPTRDFIEQVFGKLSSKCKCKQHAEHLIKQMPPDLRSESSWFEWTVDFHNAINKKLEKPAIDKDRAYMLWRHRRPSIGRTRAIVTVANGPSYVQILNLTKDSMRRYSGRVGADLIDLDNDTEDWGPMEKFRTFHFATEYEQTLFVDADCIITDRCPDLFEMYSDADIAIHDDYPFLCRTSWLKIERQTVEQLSGVHMANIDLCLNSGVILTNKRASSIWKRPDCDIGTSHCAEQIWIENMIIEAQARGLKIQYLNTKANWQWWYSVHKPGVFEAGLDDAWIVHFANAPKRYQTIKDFLDNRQPTECCNGEKCNNAGEKCCRERA